jgi:hypothetical protein
MIWCAALAAVAQGRMRARPIALVALLAAASVVACDPPPPTFTTLSTEVFQPRCANAACHDDASPERGLNLLTDPYTAMVGVQSASDPDKNYVSPGDSPNSIILQVLQGPVATGGIRQMPVGFVLDEETVRGVAAWIDAGAPND